MVVDGWNAIAHHTLFKELRVIFLNSDFNRILLFFLSVFVLVIFQIARQVRRMGALSLDCVSVAAFFSSRQDKGLLDALSISFDVQVPLRQAVDV